LYINIGGINKGFGFVHLCKVNFKS